MLDPERVGRPTRALFVASTLDFGGAETHWSRLLPALGVAGFDVQLIAMQAGGAATRDLAGAGVRVAVLGESGGALAAWRSFRAVAAAARNVDLVVSLGYNAYAFCAAVSRLFGIRHYVNWHRQPGIRTSRRRTASLKFAAALASDVIAVSDSQRPELRAYGFSEHRTVVVPNGRPSSTPDAGRVAELRREFERPDGGPIVVIVARLAPEKRVADFLRAMAVVRRSLPSAVALIVGDGSLRAELVSLAGAIDAGAHFVGRTAAVDAYLDVADLVCLTSEFEALPMALIEACAAGKPIVATNVGDVGQIVAHGINGFLVEPRDIDGLAEAMLRIARSPGRKREFGLASYDRWSSQFRESLMIERYVEVLSHVRAQ